MHVDHLVSELNPAKLSTPVEAFWLVFNPMMLEGTKAAEYVVSGSSIAKAAQIPLWNFLVTRAALSRVQVKPTT
jgi:hypothetical protein